MVVQGPGPLPSSLQQHRHTHSDTILRMGPHFLSVLPFFLVLKPHFFFIISPPLILLFLSFPFPVSSFFLSLSLSSFSISLLPLHSPFSLLQFLCKDQASGKPQECGHLNSLYAPMQKKKGAEDLLICGSFFLLTPLK